MSQLDSNDWHERLKQYDTIWLGYSGGLDSQVLLHLLSQLSDIHVKLKAIHVNHQLSVLAPSWQQHCVEQCQYFNVPLICKNIKLTSNTNIEEQARRLRYQQFARLVQSNDALLLAHHRSDQAETVLLNLLRGSGVAGLSAMPVAMPFAQGEIIRPLLSYPKEALLSYATLHQLHWVEDDSNRNTDFRRNFLRHQIFPQLSSHWPGAEKSLSRVAELQQQTQQCLNDLASIDSEKVINPVGCIDIELFTSLSIHRQFNLLTDWIKKRAGRLPSYTLLKRVMTEVIAAKADANPRVDWPGYSIRRYRQQLYIIDVEQLKPLPKLCWDCKNDLTLTGWQLRVVLDSNEADLIIPSDAVCTIRYGVTGATIALNGQSKRLKKCWQQWGVVPWLRATTPLLYIGDTLAAVLGYAISDSYKNKLPMHSGVAIKVEPR